MSLKHTISAEEVWKLTDPLVDRMTTEVANKIMELNGDQTVSATFIVGGGGKIHGFDELLAQKLELPQERVALRGAEVLKEVTFLQEEIEKDPLLVTPIGICLNYYEQKNNFIMVHFNGERLKLYDNNKLTIVDAAIQAGFPNDQLFPKRGREINFTVNGRPRIVRGEAGEAAVVRMNDRPASINDMIEPNCYITIEPSTAGDQAHYTVGELEEYQSSTIVFEVNGKLITCPRYVEVNGVLEPPYYEIQENDAVVTRSFYTVEQLAEFMDVELDPDADIYVNNRVEDMQALVYENFSVDWIVLPPQPTPPIPFFLPGESNAPEPGREAAETAESKALPAGQTESGTEQAQPEAAEAGTDLAQPGTSAAGIGQPGTGAAETEQAQPEATAAGTGLTQTGPAGTGQSETRAAEAGSTQTGAAGAGLAQSGATAAGIGLTQTEPVGIGQSETRAAEAELAQTAVIGTGQTQTGAAGTGPTQTGAAGVDQAQPGATRQTMKRAQEDSQAAGADQAQPGAKAAENEQGQAARRAAQKTSAGNEPPVALESGVNWGAATDGAEMSAGAPVPAKKEQAPETERAQPEAGKATGSARAPEAEKEEALPVAGMTHEPQGTQVCEVVVNGQPVTLKDRSDYIFVDVFEHIQFNLAEAHGRRLVTEINGMEAQYTQMLKPGDRIDIRWEE